MMQRNNDVRVSFIGLVIFSIAITSLLKYKYDDQVWNLGNYASVSLSEAERERESEREKHHKTQN